MKIYDLEGNLLEDPDLTRGYLADDRIAVRHHEAVEAIREVGHYEVVAEYPNGGRDVEWVIDIPGREAADAWDEYEEIQRYIPYPPEELAEMEAGFKTTEERIAELEAQNEMLVACLLEISEILYS